MMWKLAVAVGLMLQAPTAMTRVPQFDNDRVTSWKSIIPPRTEMP